MNKESISLIGDFLYLPVSFVQKDLPSVLVGTYASLRHVKGLNRAICRAHLVRTAAISKPSHVRACSKIPIDVANYFLKKKDFWARLASGRRSTKTGFIVRGSSPE